MLPVIELHDGNTFPVFHTRSELTETAILGEAHTNARSSDAGKRVDAPCLLLSTAPNAGTSCLSSLRWYLNNHDARSI